jgi:plasmid stabilization system protein ParE
MTYTLNITDLAEEDILAAVSYIFNTLKNPSAANDLLDKIERQEKILENTPDIFPSVQDEYLSGKGLKFVKINNYLIFFKIDEDKEIVNVIRFLYGQKDWKNILMK